MSTKKKCTRCGKYKNITEYYSNEHNTSWCISCYRESTLENYYKNKEKYIQKQRNWRINNKEEHNKRQKEYRIRHPDVQARYKKSHPEVQERYIQKYPERRMAHNAVNNAVRDGKLIKPSRCEICGKENKYLHGHHWMGYDKEFWLDVQWVCPSCHKQLDRVMISDDL